MAEPTEALTLGVARLGRGELQRHRHAQPRPTSRRPARAWSPSRVRRAVRAGTAVFIPGDALHSLEATDAELRLADAFAADSMDDVEYVFMASGD